MFYTSEMLEDLKESFEVIKGVTQESLDTEDFTSYSRRVFERNMIIVDYLNDKLHLIKSDYLVDLRYLMSALDINSHVWPEVATVAEKIIVIVIEIIEIIQNKLDNYIPIEAS